VTDDTEQLRRELQEAREQLDRMDTFLAVVAHELRNPIGPIVISLDALLLHVEKLDAASLRHRLEATRRYVDTMLMQLDRLLDFSRFRSGRVALQLAEVDLSLVVGEVLDRMAPLLQAARCELRTDFAHPLNGLWDSMRLSQVIWNLVSNAAKYASGAPIEVITRPVGNDAVLVVKDHGPGIAHAEHENVFNRFDRSNAAAHTGFGLGLWLVRRIVEAMRGKIELDSDVGTGATFTVTLPRSAL
jgi:signal transduction histidine kinase